MVIFVPETLAVTGELETLKRPETLTTDSGDRSSARAFFLSARLLRRSARLPFPIFFLSFFLAGSNTGVREVSQGRAFGERRVSGRSGSGEP